MESNICINVPDPSPAGEPSCSSSGTSSRMQTPTAKSKSLKRQRGGKEEFFMKAINHIENLTSKQEDRHDKFGEYVAAEMRSFESDQQYLCKLMRLFTSQVLLGCGVQKIPPKWHKDTLLADQKI